MLSTSCGNRYFDNKLGRVPKGFKPFAALTKFGNQVGATKGVAPNGVDFWWDEGLLGRVTGNCWYGNTGPDGKASSVTGPGVGDGNDTLPSDCATSIGNGDNVKLASLLACFVAREGTGPPEKCDWYTLPPKPGSAAAARKSREFAAGARAFLAAPQGARLRARVRAVTAAAPVSVASGPLSASGARPLGEMLAGSVAPMAQCCRLERGYASAAAGDDRGHPRTGQPEGQRRADAPALRQRGLHSARQDLPPGLRLELPALQAVRARGRLRAVRGALRGSAAAVGDDEVREDPGREAGREQQQAELAVAVAAHRVPDLADHVQDRAAASA